MIEWKCSGKKTGRLGAPVLGVCWLVLAMACSGGGGGGSEESSGGTSGSAAGGSSSPSKAGSSSSSLPAVTQACEEVCDLYAASCGARCTNECAIERLVYDEACDGPGLRFYECAKTSTFDCAEDNTILATQGCRAERTDYVTCYALEGVTCKREPALDTQCEDTPATPFSHRCVSDAVPADCVPALGAYYCCPSE